jgi:hypothetical protein
MAPEDAVKKCDRCSGSPIPSFRAKFVPNTEIIIKSNGYFDTVAIAEARL